jgi:hypothetical protein
MSPFVWHVTLLIFLFKNIARKIFQLYFTINFNVTKQFPQAVTTAPSRSTGNTHTVIGLNGQHISYLQDIF